MLIIYAYSMAWADLAGDGALDLVTGAYDVELKSHGLDEPAIAADGGVVLYEQRDGRFDGQAAHFARRNAGRRAGRSGRRRAP